MYGADAVEGLSILVDVWIANVGIAGFTRNAVDRPEQLAEALSRLTGAFAVSARRPIFERRTLAPSVGAHVGGALVAVIARGSFCNRDELAHAIGATASRALVSIVTVFRALTLRLAHTRDADARRAIEVAGCSVLDRDEVTRSIRVVAGVSGARVLVIARNPFAEVPFADAIDAEPGKTIEIALCVVLERNVFASTGHGVAHVVGAFVAIVAHAVFAEVLCTEAGYADAGKKAFVLAGRSVGCRHTAPTSVGVTHVPGAWVAIVFADDAYAKVTHAAHTHARGATYRAVRSVFDRVMDAMRSFAFTPHTMVPGAWIAVVAVHPLTRVVVRKPVAARNERKQHQSEDPKKSDQVSHKPPPRFRRSAPLSAVRYLHQACQVEARFCRGI